MFRSPRPPAHEVRPAGGGLVFRRLCRVLGGQDPSALDECIAAQQLHPLFDMAYADDLLPALAVRCNEHQVDPQHLGEQRFALLRQALMDNTLRNMAISAQALKLTRRLNRAGITPLLLKGTTRLLTVDDGNLGFRKQVDIDLLVQPDELPAAGEVFLADGYRFQLSAQDASGVPKMLADVGRAIRLSAAHHHLPPLVKNGYATSVELHRHFLPTRFQRHNPLAPLFNSASSCENLGARFLVPSTEYQLIHLVLGKLVNDGHFARRSFPIREACDLIDLLQSAGNRLDQPLLLQRCGSNFGLFHALVSELMAYRSPVAIADSGKVSNYLQLMQKRFDSKLVRNFLDASARLEYLSQELVYSPTKLPDYLGRVIFAHQS